MKDKKRGPVPPSGGRVRVTVNLPRTLLPFLRVQPGASLSKKIVGVIESVSGVKEQHTEGEPC